MRYEISELPRTVGRRELLQHGLSLAAALAIADPVWAAVQPAAGQSPKEGEGFIPLLRDLGALTLPETDTPGAGSMEIAQFVLLAAQHGVLETPAGSMAVLAALLDERAGQAFLSVPAGRRHDILAAIDTEAMDPALPSTRPEASWLHIKRLIVLGYYTSEAGASQELIFEPVPGRFDADKVAPAGGRAMANDWFGNGLSAS
ncbi:MAG TPA: gluconate 2-dehydrogenase subunit 3 family protein [Novosphingobium sp.]|nr:gluconate 2-dehydrogenase subunit 3 family protein [Novosphingobium sp.]